MPYDYGVCPFMAVQHGGLHEREPIKSWGEGFNMVMKS